MNLAQVPHAAVAAGRLSDSLAEELPSATTISGSEDELLSLSLSCPNGRRLDLESNRRDSNFTMASIQKLHEAIQLYDAFYATHKAVRPTLRCHSLRTEPKSKVTKCGQGPLYDVIPPYREATRKASEERSIWKSF